MAAVQDHLTCGGFDAWIVVGGAKAIAYDVKRGEGEQVTCWISSVTDMDFSVSFCRKAQEKYDYIAKVILDGHLAARYIYRKQLDDPDGLATQTISGSRISITEEKAFAFRSLELTDDDMHFEDPSSQNIGEIKLMIRRAESVGIAYPEVPTYGSTSGVIHENEPSVASLPHGEWITFIFNYRPLETLQAMGVVSFSPSFLQTHQSTSRNPPYHMEKPVKMETSDEEGSESEEAENIFAKEQELAAELEKVRRKLRAIKEGRHFKKRPKRESKPHFITGEVIDLT